METMAFRAVEVSINPVNRTVDAVVVLFANASVQCFVVNAVAAPGRHVTVRAGECQIAARTRLRVTRVIFAVFEASRILTTDACSGVCKTG